MDKRNPHIARALFWDALALLVLSCFELFTRLDAMWGPLKMFVNMAVGERIPLQRAVSYVDFSIFYLPFYMLLCALLALWTLFSRRTRRACAWMLLPCAALTAAGFLLRLTLFGELVRTLKLLPLALMTALCLAHLIFRPVRPRRQQPAPLPGQATAPYPLAQPQPRRRRSERRRAS